MMTSKQIQGLVLTEMPSSNTNLNLIIKFDI